MNHRPKYFVVFIFRVMACAALFAPGAMAQDAAVRAGSAAGASASSTVARDAASGAVAADVALDVALDAAASTAVDAAASTAVDAAPDAGSDAMTPEEPGLDPALCPYDALGAFDGPQTGQIPRAARPFMAPRPTLPFAYSASAPARVFEKDPADPGPVEIDIERLHGDGTRLDGQFVRVSSTRLDPDGSASPGLDGSADFRFEPNLAEDADCPQFIEDCPRFDAVNVYYHIDRFAQEFWTERMGVDITFQANVQIHIEGDGGIANPTTNQMYLRWGQLFNKNAALSDDLLYHEYSHLVTNALGFHVTFDNAESRALSEAMADYFALTYTDDPRFGEWLVDCPSSHDCPRERENDPDLRTMVLDPAIWNWNNGEPDNTLQYGFCLRKNLDDGKCKPSYNNFTDTYVWAMIWGGALWRLRDQIGADALDPMVLESMLRFEPYITFERALGHLIHANRNQQGGAHEQTILDIFAESGIQPVIFDAVEGEPEIPTGAFSVDVWPQPAAERVRVAVLGDEVRSGGAGGDGGAGGVHGSGGDDGSSGARGAGGGGAPGNGSVWLGGSVEVSLFDVTGRRVLHEIHSAVSGGAAGGGAVRVDFELDIGQLNPGVYGLRIVSGGHAVHRPIVISR